jgi:hypothetical protein
MSEIGFLIDVNPRDAWSLEAHGFTPWLAQHLDQLGAAIGMTLELQGTEVAVQDFAADILARDPRDGSLVLIENQLAATDHTHLGQILTYLTGLEAKTVIWIATQFREPHLSAIKWLNEHTADPYAFFAVRLRVVRIGDSPFAPIFEVLSKPNNWDRQLQQVAGERSEMSEIGLRRQEFWKEFLQHEPEGLGENGKTPATSNIWYEVEPRSIVVVLWVGRNHVGVFVRGWRGSDGSELLARLEPHAAALKTRLGADMGDSEDGRFLGGKLKVDMSDRANWTRAVSWLHETRERYIEALVQILGLGSTSDGDLK